MAVYATTLPGAGRQYVLELTITEKSTNKANNTSVVSFVYAIRKTSGTGYSSGYTHPWSLNIGGRNYSGSIPGYNFTQYTTLPLASDTITVTHNANGSGSVACSGSFTATQADTIGSGSVSGTLALTTFNRVATLNSAPSNRVIGGSAYTLGWTHQSSGLTHTFYMKAPNGTVLYSHSGYATGGNTSFIDSNVQAMAIFQAMSGGTMVMTYELATFSGSTRLGSSSRTGTVTVNPIRVTSSPNDLSIGVNILSSVSTGLDLSSGPMYRKMLSISNAVASFKTQESVAKAATFRTDDQMFMNFAMEKAGTATSVVVNSHTDLVNSRGNVLSSSNKNNHVLYLRIPAINVTLTPALSTLTFDVRLSNLMVESLDYLQYSLNNGAWTTTPSQKNTIDVPRGSAINNIRFRVKQIGWGYVHTSESFPFTLFRDIKLTLPEKIKFTVGEQIPIQYETFESPGAIALALVTDKIIYTSPTFPAYSKGVHNMAVTFEMLELSKEVITESNLNLIPVPYRYFKQGLAAYSGALLSVYDAPQEALKRGFRRNLVQGSAFKQGSALGKWTQATPNQISLEQNWGVPEDTHVRIVGLKGSTVSLRQILNGDKLHTTSTYTLSALVRLSNYSPGTTNAYVSVLVDAIGPTGGWNDVQMVEGSKNNLAQSNNQGWVYVKYKFKLLAGTTGINIWLFGRDFTGFLDMKWVNITMDNGPYLETSIPSFDPPGMGDGPLSYINLRGGTHTLKAVVAIPGNEKDKYFHRFDNFNNIGTRPVSINSNLDFGVSPPLAAGGTRTSVSTFKGNGTTALQYRFDAVSGDTSADAIQVVIKDPVIIKTDTPEMNYPFKIYGVTYFNGNAAYLEYGQILVTEGGIMFAYQGDKWVPVTPMSYARKSIGTIDGLAITPINETVSGRFSFVNKALPTDLSALKWETPHRSTLLVETSNPLVYTSKYPMPMGKLYLLSPKLYTKVRLIISDGNGMIEEAREFSVTEFNDILNGSMAGQNKYMSVEYTLLEPVIPQDSFIQPYNSEFSTTETLMRFTGVYIEYAGEEVLLPHLIHYRYGFYDAGSQRYKAPTVRLSHASIPKDSTFYIEIDLYNLLQSGETDLDVLNLSSTVVVSAFESRDVPTISTTITPGKSGMLSGIIKTGSFNAIYLVVSTGNVQMDALIGIGSIRLFEQGASFQEIVPNVYQNGEWVEPKG